LFEGIVRDQRALYPSKLRESRWGEGGYTYAAYLGVRDTKSGAMAALALPYKHLFNRMEKDIFGSETGTSPSYASFDMEVLYRTLEVERAFGRVTRISVQVLGEPGVGSISISGSSPLQSGIWSALEGSVEPYGLRIELHRRRHDLPALRLNIDRIGNAHWHQRSAEDPSLAFSGLAHLVDIAGQQTSHLPTKGQVLTTKKRALEKGQGLDDEEVTGSDDVV
jgi:hypothetical protein